MTRWLIELHIEKVPISLRARDAEANDFTLKTDRSACR